MKFFFHKAAAIRAVAKNHVLQFAFASLIANRAIERVIGEQKFQHGLARFVHLRRIGAHDHGIHSYQCAGGLQLRSFLHLHQTHATGRLQGKPLVVTERWNLDTLLPGRFNYQCARGHRQFAVVQLELYLWSFCHVLRLPERCGIRFRRLIRTLA